jgi:hypothetical protein
MELVKWFSEYIVVIINIISIGIRIGIGYKFTSQKIRGYNMIPEIEGTLWWSDDRWFWWMKIMDSKYWH